AATLGGAGCSSQMNKSTAMPALHRCRSMQPARPCPRSGTGDVEDFVMRPNGFLVLATVALVSPALITGAAAQMRRGGGGAAPGGAPHIAAPAAAPRMSAPAPRMSAPAPRMSAPAAHFAAPAPRVATPHVSAPASPRFSAPRHVATPHVNTQRLAGPHINS